MLYPDIRTQCPRRTEIAETTLFFTQIARAPFERVETQAEAGQLGQAKPLILINQWINGKNGGGRGPAIEHSSL